jgi:hypothetical protein
MIITTEFGTVMRLASPRSECFTHSHTDSFGGGYYCVYDLIVDTTRMIARMVGGGESCEFKLVKVSDIAFCDRCGKQYDPYAESCCE